MPPATQPRILMIDEQHCVPQSFIHRIEQTHCEIIRSVTRQQVQLQNIIQANQPLILCLVNLPTAGRRDLALLAFLKHWLPKACMVVSTADTSLDTRLLSAGADIVYCVQATPEQTEGHLDRILQHIGSYNPVQPIKSASLG